MLHRVATMYGLYGMSGPYMVLMYGSNPYIFGLNVRIKSVHLWPQCAVQIRIFLVLICGSNLHIFWLNFFTLLYNIIQTEQLYLFITYDIIKLLVRFIYNVFFNYLMFMRIYLVIFLFSLVITLTLPNIT